MASKTIWAKRDLLRQLIADAIAEAYRDEEDVPEEYDFLISPSLDEVYCSPLPWWDDEKLNEKLSEGWFYESATNYEDAIERADLYFDLR